MSLLDELGQALAAVADDPQARSAVAAEFLLRSRPPDEQTALAAAFDAAAVLRWFDAELLARVLQIPPATAAERLRQLRALPFIEPYRSGAHELVNVHESTRLGWRSKLARETPERFRALSAAAAACFADDQTPAGRIEWIYHLLSADGESGADALETIDQEWTGRAHPAQRYALATALSELEANGLLAGRARLWVLLVIGWTRIERGEAAQLAALADEALRLAVAANDARGQAGACNLHGHACQTRGQLDAALRAFTECLQTSRRLADLDPANADWQRDLGVAHNYVGSVLQAQGQLDAALLALTEGLAIFRRLAELDPGNAAWQRGLAVGCVCIAGLEAARGKPQAAVALCEEASQILAALTATLPETHPWRFEKGAVDLLLAHYRALVADDNSGWRALRALG